MIQEQPPWIYDPLDCFASADQARGFLAIAEGAVLAMTAGSDIMPDAIVASTEARLIQALRALADAKRAEREKAYQKSRWEHWGVALRTEHGPKLTGVAKREATKYLKA